MQFETPVLPHAERLSQPSQPMRKFPFPFVKELCRTRARPVNRGKKCGIHVPKRSFRQQLFALFHSSRRSVFHYIRPIVILLLPSFRSSHHLSLSFCFRSSKLAILTDPVGGLEAFVTSQQSKARLGLLGRFELCRAGGYSLQLDVFELPRSLRGWFSASVLILQETGF